MKIDIITFFPQIIEEYCKIGIVGRAIKSGIASINPVNIRDFSSDKYGHVDDTPYGGGPGMVLRCESAFAAVRYCINSHKHSGLSKKIKFIYTSPAGKTFNQEYAEDLSFEEHVIILCGRYEGVDQRIIDFFQFEEVSIGDFVLTGGEIPALAMCDAAIRLIPDVLGDDESSVDESFSCGLLEHPQFTKPKTFEDLSVPEVLLSGNHEEIRKWRREQMIERTFKRRPDLLENAPITENDKLILSKINPKNSKEDM